MSVLVDANVLLYAVDTTSSSHIRAASWVEEALNASSRVALPWQSIGAFLRISTHPRIAAAPLTAKEAWSYVDAWLHAPPVWIPPVTDATARILSEVLAASGVTGNLVPDAQLAALAIEHGLTVVSADTDFARFNDVRWENPLR